MGGHLALLRPGNGAVAASAVFAGAIAVAGPAAVAEPLWRLVAAGAGAAFCFIGAGNALNDYFDRDIDRAAHPDRPIPSGRVSPRAALGGAAGLFGAALALAATVSLTALLIVGGLALLMLAYEAVR